MAPGDPPRLAAHYRVVAPDLRGLGASSRPAGGYHKNCIADDIWELMHDVLGYDRFMVAGHDWGGPVAFSLAAAHRKEVRKLAVLDATIPGDGTDVFSTSQGRWHHGFHRTLDLPKRCSRGGKAFM